VGNMKRISKSKLNKILKQHRLWLETDTRKGERAYLRHADLRGADLRGADLRRADLRHANLREADLLGADLQGADLLDVYLQGANLWRANLRDAHLRDAHLQGADLRGAELDTNIRSCWSFRLAKFTSDALPWLILHPKWAEWKDSAQIEEV